MTGRERPKSPDMGLRGQKLARQILFLRVHHPVHVLAPRPAEALEIRATIHWLAIHARIRLDPRKGARRRLQRGSIEGAPRLPQGIAPSGEEAPAVLYLVR